MRTLFTNDDGVSSDFFRVVVETASRVIPSCTPLLVAPAAEQSWTGKAMTRFGELTVGSATVAGLPCTTVNGTPADCANFGIFHQPDDARPALLISGANIGYNQGVGFVVSSGTVGACFEANLAGLPALAFSQALPPEEARHYHKHRTFSPEILVLAEDAIADVTKRVLEFLLNRDLLKEPITWNVNLPPRAAPGIEIRLCPIGWTLYGSCFERAGDRLTHHLGKWQLDKTEGCDASYLSQGLATLSALDLRALSEYSRSCIRHLPEVL